LADAGKWSILNYMISLATAMIIIAGLYFFIPFIYQRVTIDNLKFWNTNGNGDPVNYDLEAAINRLAVADALMIIIFILNFLYFFSTGVQEKDVYLTSFGMTIGLIFVTSVAIVQMRKMSNDFFKYDKDEILKYDENFDFFTTLARNGLSEFKNWGLLYYLLCSRRSVWTVNLFVFLFELAVMTVFYNPTNWVLVVMILLNSLFVVVPGGIAVLNTFTTKPDSPTTV
jgi:hypothetical protein